MSDCIFCGIAAHQIPSTIIYEDDVVLAFKDLEPQAPVHVLVIPKKHYDNITDSVPADVLTAMVHAVQVVTHETGIDKTGFRIISNTGDDAGQSVHHLHWHVLGGCGLGAGLLPADAE